MKNLKHIFVFLVSLSLFWACDTGIDPITAVDPGPDSGAPMVNIIKPLNGFEIQVPEPVTSVDIEIKVEDDIEVELITIKLDGNEIATYNDFLDYRVVLRNLTYNQITTGDHIMTVEATDIAGNVTTSMVNFSKAPPYTPLFNGETFYMNYDGSFSDLVSNKNATEVGSPGITTNAYKGTGAYAGADDAYLTFPTAGLLGNEFSASFWYNLNNPGTNRAGIITVSAPDLSSPLPTNGPGNRNFGFRFFREGGADQSFRLNVGNGTGNGTAIAARRLNNSSGWVHIAFTITQSKAMIYMDGVLEIETNLTGLDWTGCDMMSIMSGAPRYLVFNHKSDLSGLDELRFFNTQLTQSEVVNLMAQGSKTFNMPFNGSFTETISKTNATEIGSPGITTNAKVGNGAYEGANDAYLTYPTAGLLGNEISSTFWYNLNNPGTNRAGILTVSAPDLSSPLPTNGPGNRNFGFRFFREGGADQSFRLNVGNGTGNGTAIAARRLNNSSGWVHIAFTISQTKARIYMDGVLEMETDITGFDSTDCDIMSIMSGAPRYLVFNHKSDLSLMDELAFYNKELSQAEIQAVMNN